MVGMAVSTALHGAVAGASANVAPLTAAVTTPDVRAVASHLLVDLAAMSVLVGVAYRRHRADRGMMFALFVLNVGLFATLVAITGEAFSTSAAFGLFGMLSLIRLRSASFTTPDMAYTFLALVLGLVTALVGLPPWLTVGAAVVLVALAVVGDRPREEEDPPSARTPPRTRTVDVVLDGVYPSPDEVLVEVQSRLGIPVLQALVDEVDYVREITRVRAHVPAPEPDPAVEEPGLATGRGRRRVTQLPMAAVPAPYDTDRTDLDAAALGYPPDAYPVNAYPVNAYPGNGYPGDGYPGNGYPVSPDVPAAPGSRPRDRVRRLRSTPDPFPAQGGGWERA